MANSNRKATKSRNQIGRSKVQPSQSVAGNNRKWEGVIDKILGQAVQEKEWNDLKGKGRPLDLDSPSGVPADQVMGNRIMQNNNVVPTWIEDRKALLVRIDNWRQELCNRAHCFRATSLQSERQQADLQRKLADLNKDIQNINISIPVNQLELVQLVWAEEMQRTHIP